MDTLTREKYFRIVNRFLGQYRDLFLLEEDAINKVRPIIEQDIEHTPPEFKDHQEDIKGRVEHIISRELPLGQVNVLLKNCQDQIKNNLKVAHHLSKLEGRFMIERYRHRYGLEEGDYLVYEEDVLQDNGKTKRERREGWLKQIDIPYPRLEYHLGQVRSSGKGDEEMFSVVAFVNLRTQSGKRSKKFTPFLGTPDDIIFIKDAAGNIKKDRDVEAKVEASSGKGKMKKK